MARVPGCTHTGSTGLGGERVPWGPAPLACGLGRQPPTGGRFSPTSCQDTQVSLCLTGPSLSNGVSLSQETTVTIKKQQRKKRRTQGLCTASLDRRWWPRWGPQHSPSGCSLSPGSLSYPGGECTTRPPSLPYTHRSHPGQILGRGKEEATQRRLHQALTQQLPGSLKHVSRKRGQPSRTGEDTRSGPAPSPREGRSRRPQEEGSRVSHSTFLTTQALAHALWGTRVRPGPAGRQGPSSSLRVRTRPSVSPVGS